MENKININKKLIYTIPKEKINKNDLVQILKEHKEIKFASFVGIDLWGNDTDEKIPIKYFIDHIDSMLEKGIQTDGSSVDLPEIATLSDARVDLIPDKNSTWYIDYNYENIDLETNLPIGTLRIWSFLLHNEKFVDSRYILKNSIDKFKNYLLKKIDLTDVDNVEVMLGTELEFWVRTPYNIINVENLVLSQTLKEQYWKRTKGVVRTALEQTLQLLELYGIKPEMGHKEVGGVSTYISGNEKIENHIVEQLEIDWEFDEAKRTADKELLARIIIKEVFRLHGLEVSFDAKPILEVAGNGEHCHLSIMAHCKNGKKINLLAPNKVDGYLSKIGWGMIMGILKNYKVINPFISNTNDSLNRLQPGYEAPTHVVASIGKDAKGTTRNRTVLIGLVKDIGNPLSTRFELRAPNPKTNLFLAISAILATIVDGINFSMNKNLTEKDLEEEFCKKFETKGKYLEANRKYREENDVFKCYTKDERDKLFGVSPKTVFENISNLKDTSILEKMISEDIIKAYAYLSITNWILDLEQRIIPENRKKIYTCVQLKETNDYDKELWKKISNLKEKLCKDDISQKSIISNIIKFIKLKDYKLVSDLQLQMNSKMEELQNLYKLYENNQFI